MIFEKGIPEKANRVLHLILLGFLLIFVRVWYLAVIQKEEHLEKAHKPQRRTVIEPVERGTIRDRFNIPLAVNKIKFDIGVTYAHLRQIPTIQWIKDETGKSVKTQARILYIKNLAEKLGAELGMDPEEIEDLIHAKASLFPHTPYILKSGLTEQQYYKLKGMEKDWVGLQAIKGYQRIYPQGKIGADLIGYLGAISQSEYLKIAQEIEELQSYIAKREAGELPTLPMGFETPVAVRDRLRELQDKAYTINDLIGKTGIEGSYDQRLRGIYGKKTFEIDRKGTIVRELPGGREAISGDRLILTISSELQAYAEELLAQAEAHKGAKNLREPWIKGGAVVAMEPKTGEIIALASYPRFDPNDFIPGNHGIEKKQKQSAINQWLETEQYLGEIWDGKRNLEREQFSISKKIFYNEVLSLTWDNYLDAILPLDSPIRKSLENLRTIESCCRLQQNLTQLLSFAKEPHIGRLIQALYSDSEYKHSQQLISSAEKKEIKKLLETHGEEYFKLKKEIDFFLTPIKHNDDQLLFLDLGRMVANNDDFSPELLKAVGAQTLSSLHALAQTVSIPKESIKAEIKSLFHKNHFKEWRAQEFKNYLVHMRQKEKEEKLYPKPYTDYLEKKEKELFTEFWNSYSLLFLKSYFTNEIPEEAKNDPKLENFFSVYIDWVKANPPTQPHVSTLKGILLSLPSELSYSYLRNLRSFNELNRPLLGYYKFLKKRKGQQFEKDLASAFYPASGFGYVRSQAYRQAAPFGSVFKLVAAYEALKERYLKLGETELSSEALNPLTLIDEIKKDPKTGALILGYHMNGDPIYRNYKGGRLPKSSHPHMGRVDLPRALEQSSNIYFSILASEHIDDPSSLISAARTFGFGEKSGVDLSGEYKGYLPEDVIHDKTGLYSFAIGQHSLIVTPLQSATMFSALANGGSLFRPKIVQWIAGKEKSENLEELFSVKDQYQNSLSLVGIPFPIFTRSSKQEIENHLIEVESDVRKKIFFPHHIRNLLLASMQRVIIGQRGTARPSLIRNMQWNPQGVRDYLDLHRQLVAKTGTAEILYKHTIDAGTPAIMDKHVWYAAISFPNLENKNPNEPWEKGELVVIVYLRFGEAGKDGATIAAQMIKKWREICAHWGKSSFLPTAKVDEN